MTTRSKIAWVALLYFVEGFPYGLVNSAVPTYYRLNGVSLLEIGLMSLVTLPWTLKFLWAPAVDAFGTKRGWYVSCQCLLVAVIAVLPWINPRGGGIVLWAPLFAMAVFSATQDIAIDAYTIRLLDERELGVANGVRVTTYRIALIAAGGVFVAAAGWVGWPRAFVLGAGLMALSALASSRAPAEVRAAPAAPGGRALSRADQFVVEPLRRFLERPGFPMVALFILLFKLGDMAIGPMIHPFWVDRGFTLFEIGAVPGTVGVLATISGALLGGHLTGRWGIFKGLWVLGLVQAGVLLVYAAAAALPPNKVLMYTASVSDSFGSGLGTAPFLAFLMRICDKSHAATQYALLTAIFGLTRSVAGAFSGWGVERVGYAEYFALTFALSLPAYAMLPWVRRWLTPPQGA